MSHKHAPSLSAVARIEIRFNECDPLGIVWHGNYVNYFQEGREAFGKKYGLDYMEMYKKGYATPIVHLATDFKRTLTYKDIALVETTMRHTHAAKVIFDYVIKNENTGELICKGTTTQVFVSSVGMELSLVVPEVFADWKKKNGL
ncbi:MAG TPA: acyl-CoA thioesterase [Chitinophagales bacterium]|nr:acyl-CoA thioesterase [Chitinophagales bacterium]